VRDRSLRLCPLYDNCRPLSHGRLEVIYAPSQYRKLFLHIWLPGLEWKQCWQRVSLLQFFSREFCGKWDSLLAKISLRVSWVSQEGKNAIYCEACESRNFKISIDSRESGYEIYLCEAHEKRVSIQNLSVRLTRSKSHNEISVCETRKKRVATKFVCKTHEKRVSLRNIGLRHSHAKASLATNLARILCLKSKSRFSWTFQKVIFVSTLSWRDCSPDYKCLEMISIKSPWLQHVTPDI
jgi:hypothetical protein